MFGPPVRRKTREMDWRDEARTFNPAAAAVGPTFGRLSQGSYTVLSNFFFRFFFLFTVDFYMSSTP